MQSEQVCLHACMEFLAVSTIMESNIYVGLPSVRDMWKGGSVQSSDAN